MHPRYQATLYSLLGLLALCLTLAMCLDGVLQAAGI